MTILFNCTTNNAGGGAKNAALFIQQVIKNRSILNGGEVRWKFAISPQVKEILEKIECTTSDLIIFDKSPARSFIARKKLRLLSEETNIDFVYTMAGPAYVQFAKTHLMGLSNPYIIYYTNRDMFLGKNVIQIIMGLFLRIYQSRFIRKADYWLFQTETTRDIFTKRNRIEISKTRIVKNAIGLDFVAHFKNSSICDITLSQNRRIVIFCPAGPYYHKAIHLIPRIAFYLSRITAGQFDFEFLITLDPQSKLNKKIIRETIFWGVENHIRNIGPYSYSAAISLYKGADVVFVPSVLEVFSASYLEAFASRKPLVVSDRAFSREICKDAVLYVDPQKPEDTAKALYTIITNTKDRRKLIANGEALISKYYNQNERYEAIYAIICEIIKT